MVVHHQQSGMSQLEGRKLKRRANCCDSYTLVLTVRWACEFIRLQRHRPSVSFTIGKWASIRTLIARARRRGSQEASRPNLPMTTTLEATAAKYVPP